MSQHDYDIANALAPAFRTDVNAAFVASATNNSGATAPAATYPHMLWSDTTANMLKIRSAADDAWIDLFALDQSVNEATPQGIPTGSASGDIPVRGTNGSIYADWAYTSADTAIPGTGGSVTFTHGLGRQPKSFGVFYRCTTAEHGYAIGDQIEVTGIENAGASVEYNGQASANTTSIYYSHNSAVGANNLLAPPRTGGATVILTNANWRLVAKAD